ncbi:hypothetical protein SNE40_010949 [Patella caerulea]|uniref:Uncharacterized protein n=1 Tax=Patella caerulea TaxID=87958 RepID=A0AAN8K200_PATCE
MDTGDIKVDDGDPDAETRRKLIELYKVIVNQPDNQLEILHKHRDILDIPITVECRLRCMCITLFEMHPGHNYDMETDRYKLMVCAWMETGLCRCQSNDQQFEKIKCQKKLIHVAAVVGNVPVVEYWVRCGLSLDEETTVSCFTPLFLAVVNNGIELLKYMIQNGADINVTSRHERNTPLMEAMVMRRDEIVHILLDNPKLEVNTVNFQKETALTIAVRVRRRELLPLLIARGADPNHVDCTGFTPLIHAVLEEDDKLLRLLLELGADVNKIDNRGETPLHFAVHNGIELLKYMIQNGADINVTSRYERNTPLMEAMVTRKKEIVQMLLDNPKLDVNATNFRKETALTIAVRVRRRELLPLLIARGADSNHVDCTGFTPLIHAVLEEDDKLLRLLLELGADVNKIDNRGETPLHFAVHNELSCIVKVLLENGADPNAVAGDSFILSPLLIATDSGSDDMLDVLKLLLDNGADVNITNEQGYAPIHNAAWNGLLPSLNLLLDHGSPHDGLTFDKNTPLTLAAHGKHPDVIDRLLPLNCDLNNKDKDLDTALHYAALNDDCITLSRLIRHGADPDVQNRVCTTPLWNAVYAESVEIVKALLKQNVTVEVASVGLNPYDGTKVLYSEPKTPMYVIGEKCLIELGRMLIESGYNMAKESWLLDSKDIPIGLESNESFRQYLIEAYSTPQSLLIQSRNFFRKLFGKKVTVKTEALNIPVPLKNYITLKHL